MARLIDLDTDPHGYLTVAEFAAYLTVSPKTVWKWINAALLPVYKFQGEVRIAKTDAITFIESARFQVR